jgi:aminopeptidase YwaD
MYPFPLIEDGDFDIPSVYMKDVDGERLAQHEGEDVSIEIRAERRPAKACNVIARKRAFSQGKAVYMAHIDAKPNTPGAIDNASGIIVLLLLAELLADYQGELGLEIIAINGEDYYAASGEMDYLRTQSDTFPQIMLAINMDGAGYHKTDTAYSLYNPPEDVVQAVHQTFASRQGMVEGDPWYQSDHSMFIQNQVPALAITSQFFMQEAALDITHSPKDHPRIVEPNKLTEIASALDDLHLRLNNLSPKT